MKKSRILTGILAGAMAFTAGHAIAQNIPLETPTGRIPAITDTPIPYIQIPKPSIGVNFIGETTSPISLEDSVNSYVIYNVSDKKVYNTDHLLLNPEGLKKVSKVLSGVPNGIINSSEGFVKDSKGLSEKEKIAMISAISASLYLHSYDLSKFQSSPSIKNGFDAQQASLKGDKNSFGVCDQIANHATRIGSEEGLKIRSVWTNNGDVGHYYNIVKLKDGTVAIINSNNVFMSGKNVKNALYSYQKFLRTDTFVQTFKDVNDLPEYNIITPDGEKFLKFTGYDHSTASMKKLITENSYEKGKNLEATVVSNKSESSRELNLHGFFVKEGTIIGDKTSPLIYSDLSQAGFRKSFYLPKSHIILSPSASLILGKMEEDFQGKNNVVLGGSLELRVASANKKGLNFGLGYKENTAGKIPGNINLKGLNPLESALYINSSLSDDGLINDNSVEAGLSYTIAAKDSSIKPYIVSQVSPLAMQFNNLKFYPQLTELEAGVLFDKRLSKDSRISFDPYFSYIRGQVGGGAKIKLETPYLDASVSGSAMASTYEFAPDTYSFSAGIGVNLGPARIEGAYTCTADNYSGSIYPQSRLSIKTTIK